MKKRTNHFVVFEEHRNTVVQRLLLTVDGIFSTSLKGSYTRPAWLRKLLTSAGCRIAVPSFKVLYTVIRTPLYASRKFEYVNGDWYTYLEAKDYKPVFRGVDLRKLVSDNALTDTQTPEDTEFIAFS